MSDNLAKEQRKGEKSVETTLLEENKITIINMMFQFKKGKDFSSARDLLKAFQASEERDLAFVDEVYQALQEVQKDGVSDEQLKEELYAHFKISKELVEAEKRKSEERKKRVNDTIADQKANWEKQDEELKIRNYGQTETQTEEVEEIHYKKDLYMPELLCSHPMGQAGKPFVRLLPYPKDEEKDIHTYTFAGRTYTIRTSGELFYMSTPNAKESISEYEITIAKEDRSGTVKAYGEISFEKMRDPNYRTMVFLQLLGVENLTDKELHGYIGSLALARDENGRLKEDEYRIAHLPEEYTAVMLWKERERLREKGLLDQDNVITLERRTKMDTSKGEER